MGQNQESQWELKTQNSASSEEGSKDNYPTNKNYQNLSEKQNHQLYNKPLTERTEGNYKTTEKQH